MRKLVIFGSIIFTLFFIIIFLLIFSQIRGLHQRFDERTTGLFTELESVNDNNDRIIHTLSQMMHDQNELRQSLNFPSVSYSIFETPNTIDGITGGPAENKQASQSDDAPFFLAVQRILEQYKQLELSKLLTERILESSEIDKIISRDPFSAELTNNQVIIKSDKDDNDMEVIVITLNEDITLDDLSSSRLHDLEFKATSYSGETFSGKWSSAYFQSFIEQQINGYTQFNNKYQQKFKLLANTPTYPEIRQILREHDLKVKGPSPQNGLVTITITTKDDREVISLHLDKNDFSFYVNDVAYDSYENYITTAIETLHTAEKRTDEELLEITAKEKIDSIRQDPAFSAFLNNHNLSLSGEPRETVHYYYYDLKTDDGYAIGSLAVQKQFGEIYLMDSDDIMISSLRKITSPVIQSQSSLVIPEDLSAYNNLNNLYHSRSSTTFLLAGTHEKQVDTIMIAHADRNTNRITLIGVPRDIWYQNRKINSYYIIYGAEKFVEIVGEVTGLSIDGYIFIDMYAFIDAVNILGGVEVTLAEDLIDPYYPVRDNSRWSTLYYEAGTHNLKGIEALRVARSRGTTSDFDRSMRQQQILKGVQERLLELNLTSTAKVYELFNTLFNYLQTDFTIMELVGHFITYRNSEILGQNVISTDNVLYNTYSNVYRLEDKDKQFEEGFYRGLWILLPKEENWDLIRWYVRELITGKSS